MAASWREGMRDIFRNRSFGSDWLAGITVAAVTLPLNIAMATASGVAPIVGLVSGVVGGFIAALMGGSALQITGPSTALCVMVFAIAKDFGIAGVAAAALVVGVLQLILSASAAGRLIHYVPEAVLTGFTTGVGLKILDGQIPQMLGLRGSFHALVMTGSTDWLHDISWLAVVCGLIVTSCLLVFQAYKKMPAALLGLATAGAISAFFNWDIHRVGTIPAGLPSLTFPSLPSTAAWSSLIMAALPLGLLAAVESLISARSVDRMAPTTRPHHSDLELFGQGLANMASGLVGGMPVSGVIVRSSVNAQSGARSRLAAMLHAVAIAIIILCFGDLLGILPVAGLAGLLCVIGFRLVEVQSFLALARKDVIGTLAFMAAAIGTATGQLMGGLCLGLAIYAVKIVQNRKKLAEPPSASRPTGIRAVLEHKHGEARRPAHAAHRPASAAWLMQIRQRAHITRSAFVHERASITGRVVLGHDVHIAAETSVRADEGTPFFIGDHSNIQDGVVLHALKERWVKVAGEDWAIYIGRNVSVAHQALVHGPCYVGDDSFIGFKAVVHDAVVGSGCFIGIGATVVGVEVPDRRYVAHGTIVDTQAKADALPEVTENHRHFNEDVVEVNRGLAAAYHTDRSFARKETAK